MEDKKGKFLMSTQKKAVVARGGEEKSVPLFGPNNDITISLGDGDVQ